MPWRLYNGRTNQNEQKSLKMVDCGRADAKEEGIQVCIQMGIEQGLERGREQGLAEGRETEERLLVLNMLAEGLASNLLAEISGLTTETVCAMSRAPGH